MKTGRAVAGFLVGGVWLAAMATEQSQAHPCTPQLIEAFKTTYNVVSEQEVRNILRREMCTSSIGSGTSSGGLFAGAVGIVGGASNTSATEACATDKQDYFENNFFQLGIATLEPAVALGLVQSCSDGLFTTATEDSSGIHLVAAFRRPGIPMPERISSITVDPPDSARQNGSNMRPGAEVPVPGGGAGLPQSFTRLRDDVDISVTLLTESGFTARHKFAGERTVPIAWSYTASGNSFTCRVGDMDQGGPINCITFGTCGLGEAHEGACRRIHGAYVRKSPGSAPLRVHETIEASSAGQAPHHFVCLKDGVQVGGPYHCGTESGSGVMLCGKAEGQARLCHGRFGGRAYR